MTKQEIPRHGLLIALLFVTSCIVIVQTDISSDCEQKTTCKECINFDPRCSWCAKIDNETLANSMKRCRLHSKNLEQCKNSKQQIGNLITNPASNVVYDRNEAFSKPDPNDTAIEKTYIQLRPQNLTVKLRKGQSAKINVTFKKVIDYPLDIYYVMDLSFSMNDDLKKLQDLGTSLFDQIRDQVTKNVQLGFGSFVDKVMMPFTSTVPAQLKNPCESQEKKPDCAPPFGFRHQMAITGSSTEFANAIMATRISGNIDIPEGSFDALMQIAVCEQHIKWRDGSTRVILLTTDASPHMAMDGKLAAILEANDMKCHLEANLSTGTATYEKSKTMDYPSLGQLSDVFRKNKIHSIFAVTADVEPLYADFPAVLGRDAYVSTLESDSRNIIPLINQTYSQLKGRLVLKSTDLPTNVNHQFRTFCPNGDSIVNDVMQCDGIEINDTVVFELEFMATECPNDPERVDKIVLSSSSLQDEVTINLEYLCECDCQHEVSTNSSECNNHGDLRCGLCTCNNGREGSLCQCAQHINGKPVKESCKRSSESTKLCEGRGECECGTCKSCAAGFTGTHCECQTTGCPSSEDKVCGGLDKGKCLRCPGSTNKCQCEKGYTIKPSDNTCTCHNSLCKANKTSDKICSGHGYCACDKCNCTDEKWSGTFCHECKDPDCTAVDKTCGGKEIRKCAECKSRNDNCEEKCPKNEFIIYSKVNEFPICGEKNCSSIPISDICKKCNKQNPSVVNQQCSNQFEDGCSYNYHIIWRTDHRFDVYVRNYDKERDCPQPVNALFIVLPVVGGIVLAGIIALVAWKVIVSERDRRRYEDFLEEAKKRQWTKGENPIFEKPQQKFENPMFDAGASIDG